jgi:hypothetical protein
MLSHSAHVRILLTAVVFTLLVGLLPQSAQAFPGERNDEKCEELVQQALVALETGQQVTEPDCINAPGMSAMEMRAAYAQMQLYPLPNIRQLPKNDEVLYARRYRRLVGEVPIFDAPNGTQIDQVARGYNYVTIGQVLEGWIQIGTGRWVQTEYVQDADVSELTGVEILGPLERPFAWIVSPDRPRPSVYPGGPQFEGYERLAQYTIVSIYGIEVVDGYEWYLIGPNRWIQQIRVAKVKPVARPADVGPTDLWVAVDLFEQTAVAYEGDNMVFATLISSGLPQWSTNKGLFQIYQRWTATVMTGAVGQPDFYLIERVPWVMYFDGDIGLHGTYWHDRFGYRQSHGCVNLSIQDSHWLYQWTSQMPEGKAWVYVYSSGEYRSDLPAWARRPRS